MALAMVEAAEKGPDLERQKLPQRHVMDASAGNTAPALAMVCAAKGYKAKFVLYRYQCEGEPTARMKIVQTFGPEVTVSSEPNRYLSEEQMEELFAQYPDMNRDLLHVIAGKDGLLPGRTKATLSVFGGTRSTTIGNYLGQVSIGEEIYEQLGRED